MLLCSSNKKWPCVHAKHEISDRRKQLSNLLHNIIVHVRSYLPFVFQKYYIYVYNYFSRLKPNCLLFCLTKRSIVEKSFASLRYHLRGVQNSGHVRRRVLSLIGIGQVVANEWIINVLLDKLMNKDVVIKFLSCWK